jgi:SAM-dependent methyltransferase
VKTLRRWLALALLWPLAAAAEENLNPGINEHYRNPDYGDWVEVFERPGRELFDRRFQVVHALRLAPGMRVADIGAGTGLFSRLMARAVRPQGRVVAVDIAPNFVDNLVRVAREQGIANLEGVVNDGRSTGLPPASVDLVFLSDTYHHFEYPRSMLDSIHRSLRSGGELVVIDFERIPGVSSPWVMGHVRGDREQVIEEIEAAGFALTETRPDLLGANYFLRFRRMDEPEQEKVPSSVP